MQECKKCGTCCEKNGPTLHIEDKYLVTQGSLPPSNLVTLRRGEAAFDPVKQKTILLENEIIKIKGSGNTWRCTYYDPHGKTCTIYTKRPAECRLLQCWNTKPLLSMMNKNILSREILLGKIGGLYDLIIDHEEKCSYHEISTLLDEIEKENRETALERLKEIILYDINIRKIVSEKQAAAGSMLDLIFGRPITETIEQFKYKAKYSPEEGLKISPFKMEKILEGSIS